MTTKTKAFETKDALDLYKKIIYTEGKAGRRMDKKQIEEMIDLAIKQRGYSYAPYSHFHVGAALLAKNGTYYTGCNIENASFGATICAERCAIFKAVSDGCTKIDKIVIVCSTHDFAYPCGICRQVMTEFMDENGIIVVTNDKEIREYKLSDLMPESFRM